METRRNKENITPNNTATKIKKRKRTEETKRNFDDIFKIQPQTTELSEIPTNHEVINFLYGNYKSVSLEKRCFLVAKDLKILFDNGLINYGVKIDRIAQKLKSVLKKVLDMKKKFNTIMETAKKSESEKAFCKYMSEIFSVGLIPEGLELSQASMIGKSFI